MTSDTYYLTKCIYSDEKRRIVAEFSTCSGKKTTGFSFFPSFFLEKGMDWKGLTSVLSNYKPQKFKVEEGRRSFKVSGSSFLDLKCIANLCLDAFGYRPALLEPERQFLILKGWSYFDGFSFGEEEPVKVHCNDFPKTCIDSAVGPLYNSAEQLLEECFESGKAFISALALSNILRVPARSVPDQPVQQAGIFIENLLFENRVCVVPKPLKQKVQKVKSAAPRNSVEMDFSELWPLLLTKPFYNLGFDSVDCDCCVPSSVEDNNVLPSSIVECASLSEGLYFESLIPQFSAQFHSNKIGTENRLRLKNEFYLNYLPVGPFSRGERAELPLADAVAQAERGKFKPLASKELHWFCLKKESFISKGISALNRRVAIDSKKISADEKAALRERGILASSFLGLNPDFVFRKAFSQAATELCKQIPSLLSNSDGGFYSQNLAMAVSSVQASTLYRFSELLKERRSRIVGNAGLRAFVSSKEPMAIAREFSKREKLPILVSAAKKVVKSGF